MTNRFYHYAFLTVVTILMGFMFGPRDTVVFAFALSLTEYIVRPIVEIAKALRELADFANESKQKP